MIVDGQYTLIDDVGRDGVDTLIQKPQTEFTQLAYNDNYVSLGKNMGSYPRNGIMDDDGISKYNGYSKYASVDDEYNIHGFQEKSPSYNSSYRGVLERPPIPNNTISRAIYSPEYISTK